MNSTIIEVCKTHTPNKAAISVVAHSFENADYFTFCEVCEQNIESFCFYDDDRGIVYSKWSVSK